MKVRSWEGPHKWISLGPLYVYLRRFYKFILVSSLFVIILFFENEINLKYYNPEIVTHNINYRLNLRTTNSHKNK
jgi:hypothetical protein